VSSLLEELDERKRQLEEKHPGWHVWYVPHHADRAVTWCAQQIPTLNEDSPEALSEAIERAEAAREMPVCTTTPEENEQ
jgi:hypothetical protein